MITMPRFTLNKVNANAHTFPNNLPPELLAEIFKLACDHKKTTPFKLGKVCAAWRAIVWSTPELWSHISLRLVSPRVRSTEYARQITVFKHHLARSGGCLLTLALSAKKAWRPGIEGMRIWHWPWNGSNPVPEDFMHLLAESMGRWQSVEFDGVPTLAAHAVLEEVIKTNGFPYLHTLKIIRPSKEYLHDAALGPRIGLDEVGVNSAGRRRLHMEPSSSDEDVNEAYTGQPHRVPWKLDLVSVAPALRTVELRSCSISDVDLPWHQLTSLTLHGIYRHECLLALHKAENLTYLKVTRFPYETATGQSPPGQCLHPTLEHLVLGPHTADFLGHLTTPALHTLEMTARNVNWDSSTLPQLLDAMGCRLRRLKLSKFRISSKIAPEINIVHIVRQLSSLEDLEVRMKRRFRRMVRVIDTASIAADTDILNEMLKPRPGTNTHFLPNLTHFSYSGPLKATPSRFDENILQQLQFRLPSAAAERNLRPLLSFSVDTRNGYNPLRACNKALLRGLAEDGLHFNLSGSECEDDDNCNDWVNSSD